MSVQFRTRSKTSVDYSDFINQNAVGLTGCCYQYDSKSNTVSTVSASLSECNKLNGYFLRGSCDNNVTITPSSIGCCCACKNNSDFGTYLRPMTFCECQERSGLWRLGECNMNDVAGQCISDPPEILDYRNKRACCHPTVRTTGEVEASCTDVCTEKECADLAFYPYVSTFYKNGRRCQEQVGAGRPVVTECEINTNNANIINSCTNGTNLFCWNVEGYSNSCLISEWYRNRFAGKFLESVSDTVFEIRKADSTYFDVILGPRSPSFTNATNEAKETSSPLKKICSGGYSLNYNIPEPDRWFEGYFAALTETNSIKYVKSANYTTSAIPDSSLLEPAIDLIATRTFSAFINENNDIRIYGRFFNPKTNQSKPAPVVTDKLKKLYQHNLSVEPIENNQVSYSLQTIGFIGQKLNGSFEYYSPFINDDEQLRQLRDMVRSIPPKNFIEASFGAYTFCGIDESFTMTCESLNSELSFPVARKYKLVSCSNYDNLPINASHDITKEYCFAVDMENRFVKIANQLPFDNEPDFSVTNVTSLSCVNAACQSTVEPDETVCNSQIIGSCCYCLDGSPDCKTTNLGECQTRYNGSFISGGVCCDENPVDGCFNCSEIQNLCEGNSNTFRRITSSETTLPTDPPEFYQNGLFVGLFEPGVPINGEGSTVRGNPYTGTASEYKPTVVGYGTTAKKWGIVVASNDFDLGAINNLAELPEIIPGSMYDGVWNTYGNNETYYGIQSNTMETLRNSSRISGWYLPSKNELEFINKQLIHGFFIPESFKAFDSDLYLTSTPYFERQSNSVFDLDKQVYDGYSFMYAQSFRKSDYGATYLVPRTKSVKVRLIRRIELE